MLHVWVPDVLRTVGHRCREIITAAADTMLKLGIMARLRIMCRLSLRESLYESALKLQLDPAIQDDTMGAHNGPMPCTVVIPFITSCYAGCLELP